NIHVLPGVTEPKLMGGVNRCFRPRNEEAWMSDPQQQRHRQIKPFRVCADSQQCVSRPIYRHFLPPPTLAVKSFFRSKSLCQRVPARHSALKGPCDTPHAKAEDDGNRQIGNWANIVEKFVHPKNLIATLWVLLHRADG